MSLNPLVAAYMESLAARGFAGDNQGFIVTTLKGEVLAEHNADKLFNPASVTKIATSLTAISRLGPDFKFRTSLYTDGALEQSTGKRRYLSECHRQRRPGFLLRKRDDDR